MSDVWWQLSTMLRPMHVWPVVLAWWCWRLSTLVHVLHRARLQLQTVRWLGFAGCVWLCMCDCCDAWLAACLCSCILSQIVGKLPPPICDADVIRFYNHIARMEQSDE